MTPSDYYWKRSKTPGTTLWLLHERWPDSELERIVGTVVKAKDKARCRVWNVRCWNDPASQWQTEAVLRGMKPAEVLDAAKLILLSLKQMEN